MRRTQLVGVVVLAAAACGPPVSDEATVTLSGLVQSTDGQPRAAQSVKLWKSAAGGLRSDIVADWLVSSTLQPFRTLSTTADGRFTASMPGTDANNDTLEWAAQFMVTVQLDATLDAAAVGSKEWVFSNNALTHDAGTLRFWDLQGAPTVSTTAVSVTLPRAADSEAATKQYLVATDGSWLAETPLAGSIPLSALEPCQELAVNATDPCTPKTQHDVFAFATGGAMRYRTAKATVTATNPKGGGLSLRQANNQSGRTCGTGRNIFDLNDHRFSGTQGVANLSGSDYDGERGCLWIAIAQGATTVREFYLHNAQISATRTPTLTVSTTTDDPTGAPAWTTLTASSCEQGGWEGYLQARCSGTFAGVRGIKFELTGVQGAAFQSIGEIVVYDQ